MEEKDYEAIHLDYLYNRREFLDKVRIDLSISYDKYLLTFATGSLYLSILFTNNIEIITYKNILAIGWFTLVLSICVILISILSSIYAFEKQISITDKEIKEDETFCKHNYWNKFSNLLLWFSTFSFIIGIISLVIFYFKNI